MKEEAKIAYEPMKYNAELSDSTEARSFSSYKELAVFLWGLLDDIDTADDIAKGNEKLYRNLVRKQHEKRWLAGTSDGYSLDLHVQESE